MGGRLPESRSHYPWKARLSPVLPENGHASGRKRMMRTATRTDPRQGRVSSITAERLVSRPLIAIAFLGLVFYVARYWHAAQFGLYEDDFTIVPGAVQTNASALFQAVGTSLIQLGGHGRPLSNGIYSLLVHLGWRIDGLKGAYGLGFVVTLLNIALFYWLARRVGGRQFALISGVAYCLYSADTTQVYLNHSLGLQPALTFFYLATHAWLSRKTWLVYPAAVGALLTYETVYPLLFAIPLMLIPWDRRTVRRLVANSGILLMILAVDVWARAAIGEGRVAGLDSSGVFLTPIFHMLVGPVVSLGTFLYRPFQAIQGLSVESAVAMLVASCAFYFILLRVPFDFAEKSRLASGPGEAAGPSGWLTALRRRYAPAGLSEPLRRRVYIAAAGVVLLVLAYPLTFTVRPYAISGRDTRVHFAAIVGASLLVGWVVTTVLHMARTGWHRKSVAALCAALFGLLLGYGLVVQADYALAWQYQREFWSRAVRLVPDVQQGMAILVDPGGLRDTRQIGANYWNMPRVLDQIYQFPSGWDHPPRVYRLTPDWAEHILTPEGDFRLDLATTVAPPSTYGSIPPADVILLASTSEGWARLGGPMMIGGQEVAIRPIASPGEPPYPHAFLYTYLITPEGR